ncbi:Isoleucine--tRNA ligase [compost metagenome]
MLALREQVSKVLEPMRANGAIGAALEAEITVAASEEQAARWQPLAEEMRFLFISGDVSVRPATTDEVFVSAQPTEKAKCVRCWHYRADVGSVAAHPELCGRCVINIEGAGEERRWF